MFAKKSKRLKLDDRVTILRRLEIGEISTNLAAEYGITMSAISHMKKNKDSIMSQKRMIDEIQGNPARKRFTGIENSPLDRCLYDWYMEKKSIGESPSRPVIQEQALIFNKMLNGPDTFKASSGFVAKFKKRYDIGALSNDDEETSTSLSKESTSEKFCREFSQYLENHDYGMDQLYSIDETELSWKSLPRKLSIVKNEPRDDSYSAVGQKTLDDDRVRIVACTNASGTHKLPLLVVGNIDNPRCFKNIRALPVVYRAKKYSTRYRDLLLDWYVQVFIPEVTKRHGPTGEKCLLLLAGTSNHPNVEAFDRTCDICTVTYLPTDVATFVHPMSRVIIDGLKRIYKRNLLRLVLAQDSSRDIEKFVASLTYLQCCNYLSVSWNEITATNVRDGWKNIFPRQTANADDVGPKAEEFLRIIRRIPEYSEITLEEMNLWLNREDNEPELTNCCDEEFFNDVYRNEASMIVKVEGENCDWEPSPKEALRGVDSLISWYQTRWECSPEKLEFLEKLRSLAVSEIISNKLRGGIQIPRTIH